jgi:DegV family protein with EDD domain
MPNVKIVTDSLADIPLALLNELDITTVPCIVRFGSIEFRDRIDLSLNEFYRRLAESPTLPSTSQPAVGVFEETYRQLAETTDAILSIHLTGALSGTLNTARLAAQNISNVKIELVDSQQVTMALGWLVILAARAARAGYPLAKIKAIVEDAIPRVHLVAMLDTLEYAQRGGRLGKAKALVGTLLNVKPLLSVEHSEVVPVENVRTQKRALERLVEIVLGSGPIQELAVIHAAAEDQAKKLRQMLAETFPEDRIILTEAGPVLGAHVGPGAVGIAWLAGKY